MSLKYLWAVLFLSCSFIISSCSGDNDQETTITQDVNLSQQVTNGLDENIIPQEAQKKKAASIKKQAISDNIKLSKNEFFEGGVRV